MNPESLTLSEAPAGAGALLASTARRKARGDISLLQLLGQGVGLFGLRQWEHRVDHR